MFVRQVKRKCSVRGCKNTDCFAISRTREVGNTVIICKSCLGNALSSLDEVDPKTKSNITPLNNVSAPALFFNATALGRAEEAALSTTEIGRAEVAALSTTALGRADTVDKEPDRTDDAESEAEKAVTEYKCDACGKTFDSEKGLKTHFRYCKGAGDE